ncbi:hypothetical protein JCM11251_004038 [Rhodosporidiobolus azoricus]
MPPPPSTVTDLPLPPPPSSLDPVASTAALSAASLASTEPSRPPLQRSVTAGSANSAASGGGGGGGGAAGCRLLWRGKVVTPDGRNLHGVAIIAHLFTLSSSSSSVSKPSSAANSPSLPSGTSPHASTPSGLNPFDDPFASAASTTASGADMCLGLEMLRGGDIRVKTSLEAPEGEVVVRRKGEPSPAKYSSEKKNKGKGKRKAEEEREELEVETPTDVRVYVDERCEGTVSWFEDMFCREGREGVGVRLDAGGEDIVIFASYPQPIAITDPQEERENVDPSASTSTSSSQPPRPPLTLLLGRPSKSATRKPRPDDPLPRENLFTKKLRKTASLPASSFGRSTSSSNLSLRPHDDPCLAPARPSLAKPKRQTAKDKAIASLLGGPGEDIPRPPPQQQRKSSLPPARAFPPPPPLSSTRKSGMSRSASSSHLFPSSGRDSSLPAPAAAAPPSRRSSLSSATSTAVVGTTRTFQRTRSRSSMLLDSPPSSDVEGEGEDEIATLPLPVPPSANGVDFLHPSRFATAGRSRAGSRGPSPTPSVASTSFPGEGEEGEEESQDAVAELRSFSSLGTGRAGATGGVRGRGGMSRSSSLPVGQFSLGGGADGEKARKRRRMEEDKELRSAMVVGGRAGSVPPVVSASAGAGEQGEVEVRNKNTVKKMIASRLTTLGIGKDYEDWRDLFSFTSRGVGFAMRSTFRTVLLTPPNRHRAGELIDQHLRMYLPSSAFPPTSAATLLPSVASTLPTPTPEPSFPPYLHATSAVKPEPMDDAGPATATASTLALKALPSLPSPKSLGDLLPVLGHPGGAEADGGGMEDVEMEMTQEA